MSSISSSIANSLGVGSGIDSSQVVADLVAASRDPKQKAINSRISTNNARISGLASATSSIKSFSKALNDVLSGTGFSGQPASNDPTIANVSLLPGGVPTGLPAQIEVQRLASAQTMESATLASKTSTVGTGSLTLSVGGTNYAITPATNTLEGLAAAFNASGSGVTASVVTDNRGARLVLKGATGGAGAFTVSAGTADAALQQFTTGGGLIERTAALDSIVVIDGVELRNSSNTLDTAIPFVRIDLNKAEEGTFVTLASTEPTTTVRDLVTEFVTAYNTLRTALNGATAVGADPSLSGALAGDQGTREVMRQLSRLTLTSLADSGPYRTLSDIGVKTNRDGTLALDTERLDKVIAENPTALTQMLNPAVATATNPGLAGAVEKISDTLLADTGALSSATKKYEALRTAYAKQLEKLDIDMERYEARTAAAFSRMDTQLATLKATQSYIDQQIKVWTNSDS